MPHRRHSWTQWASGTDVQHSRERPSGIAGARIRFHQVGRPIRRNQTSGNDASDKQEQLLPIQASTTKSIVIAYAGSGPPPISFGAGFHEYNHYVTELAGLTAALPAARVDLISAMTLDPTRASSLNRWSASCWTNNQLQSAPVAKRNEPLIIDNFTAPLSNGNPYTPEQAESPESANSRARFS